MPPPSADSIRIVVGAWEPAPLPGPADAALAAIGDVHGQADLLAALENALADSLATAPQPRRVLIRLGDLVDRGPDSRRALLLAAEGLVARYPLSGLEEVTLCGNHDRFLIRALAGTLGAEDLRTWIELNGGWATLADFGIAPTPGDPGKLAAALRAHLDPPIRALLARMVPLHREGAYVFAHAGIDPTRPLAAQDIDTLTWIRTPFLRPDAWPHDFVVVHGHSIEAAPTVRPHRIGIDQGAFANGRLTAVEIRGAALRFVQAVRTDIPPAHTP